MTQSVTRESTEQVDRPDENWKYPYAAGVVDFKANLRPTVTSVNDAAVGYRISLRIQINNSDKTPLGFLDEFCMNHGIQPRLREMENTNRLTISKRDDVKRFLRLIAPYVIGNQEAVSILLDDLIPGLEARKHSERRGFLELMRYVDQLRDVTKDYGSPTHTEASLRDEWDM